jgi:hypothetical protein
MERDFLIGWGFVSGENPADNVGATGSATNIRKLIKAKSFNDVVEVGRRVDREASE